MSELGTPLHFAGHRSEYLTRVQAAERIEKSRKTIERYLAAGLPLHRILGAEYIHVEQLLEVYRSKHKAQRSTRFTASQ